MTPLVDLDAVTRVFSRKQLRSVVEASARINIWHGAVRSGKTVASLLAFLYAVANADHNGVIFCVGRSIQTVERNIIDVLMQEHGPFGPFAKWVAHTRGATTASIFGRTVHLVGASDLRAEGRIRGSTAALIYIDEATLIPEGFFQMCLSRLSLPGSRMLCTTNPDGPQHWLRQKFLLREQELNLRAWHFGIEDNPFLSESYKRDLRAEYTGLFYRRMYLGHWCLAEGAVYEMWNPDVHVVRELPLIEQWVGVGVDYGTTNPFAAELLALGSDGVLYLASEYYYNSKIRYRQLTDHEYSREMRAWLDKVPVPGTKVVEYFGGPERQLHGVSPQYVVVDPSAASFRIQLYQDGIGAILGDNAVLPGIRLTASLLSAQRLKVHESCVGFITEVPGYSWDPKAAEKGEDAPIKVDDHALDAARYVLQTTEMAWHHRLRPAATSYPKGTT